MSGRWRFAASGLAAVGAIWGTVTYQILWGYTSIVVTRSFVDTPLGLLALFPVRVVLFGIRLAEGRVAHHAFDFQGNHWWIGVTAAGVGAVLLLIPFALGTVLVRRLRVR